MASLMFSVPSFCAEHGISKSLLYKLWQEGSGPKVTRIRGRTLISSESAAEWRRQKEAETEQPGTKH